MEIQPPMDVSRANRRAFALGLVRAAFSTVLVLVAYFVLPLDHLADVSVFVLLPVALVGFAAGIALEVRGILGAEHPAIRAVEALARDVPIFLVLFASTYYVMALAEPRWFNEHLSRIDALYFTVTIFTTVGFGDITARSEQARTAVTIQMAADLLVIGFGLRIILGAVRAGRARGSQTQSTGPDV